MASTSVMDAAAGVGHWVWDDSERGVVFLSHAAPDEIAYRKRRNSCAPARSTPGCLMSHLDITFVDAVDALDQMRFKRHIQRRVQPGEPDVVTLRDVKDVVLFQAGFSKIFCYYEVQQPLPGEFLAFFHTAAVDRFLRALILYCFCYIQTWEWLSFASMLNKDKVDASGLSNSQKAQKFNLQLLRALLAREYVGCLLGVGHTFKFHHMSNGVQSWSQRDASLWELLLRLSVRVAWVALQRRHLNLIDVEVGRIFRGNVFNSAARRHQSGEDAPKRAQRPAPPDRRECVLHDTPPSSNLALLARSPVALELLSRNHSWMLLAQGVLPIKSVDRMQPIELAFTLPEEELLPHGLLIGILGMPRSNLDTMLSMRDKQRRQETLLSACSMVGRTYGSLFEPGQEYGHLPTQSPPPFPRCALVKDEAESVVTIRRRLAEAARAVGIVSNMSKKTGVRIHQTDLNKEIIY